MDVFTKGFIDGLPVGLRFRARAPLRLGLAGGGTDLTPYCDLYGGAVLNATISRFAYASLFFTNDNRVSFRSADLGITEEHDSNNTGRKLPLHAAVYQRLVRDFRDGVPFGACVTTMCDAPPGSGLGSSSAVVVALVDVFREALGLPLGRYDVAHLAFEIERMDLSLAGGKQDQYAAAFGGVSFTEFFANDRVIVNPLRVSPGTLRELQSSLIVCYTGQSRNSEDIIRAQVAGVSSNDAQSLENMHRLKSDAVEMKIALLRNEVRRMGSILNRSWEAKKKTAIGISNPIIERLWDVAHRNGAIAGKISGAGGGGFMMLLAEPDEIPRLMRALRNAGGEPEFVSFTNEGVEAWGTGSWAA